jgi:aspartate/methionine/tyrosine aminotransferase
MLYLGSSPENLFQRIKATVRSYEEKHGAGSSINVAVGEPDTAPPETVRNLVAKYASSPDPAVHTYWDNRDSGSFNAGLLRRVANFDIEKHNHLSSLVLPGEKPMLGLLLLSCGAKTNKTANNSGVIRTAPAYDLVGQWAEYIDAETDIWPLFSQENFRLNIDNLPKKDKAPRMIITVKPGNPCPVGATREDWEQLISYCLKNNVRLVNDGAYTSLTHKNHVPLCEVAKDFPELDWLEMFSISKTLSACGWRLGTAVGSKDFIAELVKVKGNADSGPFGPALMGVDEYFSQEKSIEEIKEIQQMYQRRLAKAIPLFTEAGYKLACPTDAGFFILFHCPKTLDGQNISNGEEFNQAMIAKTGLVGVPFVGAEKDGKTEHFIRYSVCANFEDEKFFARVENALQQVKIG